MTEELAPGSRVGRFRILDLLGRGGMGAVYRAHDEELDRPVALKVMSGAALEDARAVERFRREARAAAAVTHGNVAVIHEAGEHAGRSYIALELLEGGSVAERIRREGPLPWREAALLGAAIADGLAAIHAAGILHRDLKPANVLLDAEGRPKITDFGLAAERVDGTGRLTRTGELLGTLEFAAPEQLQGVRNVDERADLYGLGATLFAFLTGRPPFEGTGVMLMKKHLMDAPRPPRALEPSVPRALDALVLRLLSKRPAKRGGASETARALREIAASTDERRPRWAPVAIGLVAIALVAVARPPRRDALPEPPPSPPPVRPLAAWTASALPRDGRAVGVSALAVSRDGGRLLAGGDDGSLELWDLAGPRRERRWEPPGVGAGRIRSVAFAGEQSLSAAADGSVVLRDLAGDASRSYTTTRDGKACPASAVAVDETRRVGFVADGPGQLWHWNLDEDPPPQPIMNPVHRGIVSLALSPDLKWLASANESSRHVHLFPLTELGTPTLNFTQTPDGPDGPSLVVFPSNEEVVRARGRVLERLSVPDLKALHVYPERGGEIVALDARERLVLSASQDGQIEIRSIPAYAVVVTEAVAPDQGLPLCARLRDSDSFVVGTDRGAVLVYRRTK